MMTLDEALMCADDDWSNTEGERILAAEVRRLREENERLRNMLGSPTPFQDAIDAARSAK